MRRNWRKVDNLPKLVNLDGTVDRFIKDFWDLEVERILKAEKILKFNYEYIDDFVVEQEIIFKKERYILTVVETEKDETGRKYVYAEAQSSFIELGKRILEGRTTITTSTVRDALTRILQDEEWSAGEVDVLGETEPLVSVDEEDHSILSIINLIADMTGYEVEYDTLNKKVNMRKEIGRKTDNIIRYADNLKGITRTVEPPRATRIWLRGRDGLTIENVNDGKKYLEDYSYYTDELGIDEDIAKSKYRKDYVYSDERFIYSGNLKSKGESELERLSKPIVSYKSVVESIGIDDVQEGDYLYVIDDDLKIRRAVRIVRIVDKLFREYENEIELDHLEEELGSMQDSETDGAGSSEGKVETIVEDNKQNIEINNIEQSIFDLAVTSFSSTNLMMYITLVVDPNTDTELEYYVEIAGIRYTPRFRETLFGGVTRTLSISTPLTGVDEGVNDINMVAYTTNGEIDIGVEGLRVVIQGVSILGGEVDKKPGANVIENVSDDIFEVIIGQIEDRVVDIEEEEE